jgi:predicted amidohydrolase
MNATSDRAANLAEADRLTREAARAGAELVLLPEKWSVLGSVEDLEAGAEPLDGPALTWARDTARELAIDLVAGSIVERLDDGDGRGGDGDDGRGGGGGGRGGGGRGGGGRGGGGRGGGGRGGGGGQDARRLANTSVHFSPDGSVAAVYRKIHMFDVLVDGVAYHESRHERPGSEIVTSRTVGGVELGLSICYDVRFPELYRILTLRGARILLVPAAFTLATTRDHWATLLRARAIENQAFVVAANQIGHHPPSYRSGGRSVIIDPWGVVLAQAPDTVCQIQAPLDLRRQEQIRSDLPALANRRPDAYAWPAGVD